MTLALYGDELLVTEITQGITSFPITPGLRRPRAVVAPGEYSFQVQVCAGAMMWVVIHAVLYITIASMKSRDTKLIACARKSLSGARRSSVYM